MKINGTVKFCVSGSDQAYSLGAPTGLSWPTLKSDLLAHFHPVDYAYQSRLALSRCRMTGDVRAYVRAFRLRLVRCDDVTEDEAL
ncbi:MAG: hypothetical protein AAF335_04930, partial [Bacteroidota bacterium]